MRRSEQPQGLPGTCAIIPGRARDPNGFIITGHILGGWDPQIVFSDGGAKELARFAGYYHEDYELIKAEREEYRALMNDALDRVKELERELDAVNVLESAGFQKRLRKGPKPKQSEEVVV